MKKTGLLFLLFFLLLCACSRRGENAEQENGYQIYYINKDGTKIVSRNYEMQAWDNAARIKELLAALQEDSGAVDVKRPIPADVAVTEYDLSEEQLSIGFDGNYLRMDAMTEVLCRAAVVRTMTQLKDVSCVSFYIDGAPLTDKNGNVVGVMTNDSFVENPGEQINSFQEATVTLYFANKAGDGLVRETQKVHYSSNISMEKLVVERLLEGPLEEGKQSAIPQGTKLVSVSTVDGVCYVNFDESFLNQNYEIKEEVVIYSIVDSLSELSSVSKVQIAVNGDTRGKYRDDFAFDMLYDRNLDYLTGEKEEGTETE